MAPPQRSKGAVIGEVGTNSTKRHTLTLILEHSPYAPIVGG